MTNTHGFAPKILEKELPLAGWKIFFPSPFSNIILDKEDNVDAYVSKVFESKINSKFNDFREQLTLKTCPFLVGYFFKSKEIRLYTPRLNEELFLLQYGEPSELVSLREHAEKVAFLNPQDFPSVIDWTTYQGGLPRLDTDERYTSLEEESSKLVEKLLVKVNKYSPSLFEKFSDYGLGLTAQFALLRIHLLKFLAILPSLDHDKTGQEVKRILLESMRRLLTDNEKARLLEKSGQESPLPGHIYWIIKLKFHFLKIIPAGPLAFSVRMAVRFMAKRFIAGETIESAESGFKDLFKTRRDVTLDQLGELVVSEKEADHYKEEVLKLIRGFSLHIIKGSRNDAGIERAHVSIKVSALCSDFKPEAFDYTYKLVAPRLKEILLIAREHQVFINIDAEHYHYRDVVFKIYKKVLLDTPDLTNFAGTGIVVQAYLRDAYLHLEEIIDLAKERGLTMPIRLVKGAYWDAETVEADAHSFNAPEFLNKEETDIHFRQLVVKTMESNPHVQLCLASHNFSDHCFAEVLREKYFKDIPVIEHQCLHMTYEALSTAMAEMGWVVRNYVPIGSLLVGMAYLVRRIMENSSQVGVLTIMRSHKKVSKIQSPMQVHGDKKLNGTLTRDKSQQSLTKEYFNIPPVLTYLDQERIWMDEAINDFKENLGAFYKNPFFEGGDKFSLKCSSDPSLIVGEINFATKEITQKAIERSDEVYAEGTWAGQSWVKRAAVLTKAADIMLAKRLELCALICFEAGKSIAEGLADVDEAIDFLNFYAREEAWIHKGEEKFGSRGVIAVIAPWNFPLAIPCGMVSAALVAGNTVILKSAEQTPLIAAVLTDLFYEAGLPKDILIHTPGPGETVGQTLVEDKRVAGIVFTGSKAVGMHISNTAAKRIYHNKLYDLKIPVKVITEMGGKNAVIVTANAELDETVSGILYSAFAHAGQKCSACSRILVDNSVKGRLVERLKEAIADLKVDVAYDYSTAVNPIITEEDQIRLRRQVVEASKEPSSIVHIDRSAEELPGYCVGPVLIEVDSKQARNTESFAVKELFGPVIHIIGFDSNEEAVSLFNFTDYALTGGIFSQSQDDIDWFANKLECGNLYINRSITGARVAIEPFGGFKLSGTGPKAGSKSYLQAFHTKVKTPLSSSMTPDEVGSEEKIELAGRSSLSCQDRSKMIYNGTALVLEHFESLYQGIYGDDKIILNRFHKWMRKSLPLFQEKEHKNRIIPGQLSFNDYSMVQEHVVVTAYERRTYFPNLLNVLGALSVGSGVTVFARNETAFKWWRKVQG
ncbi:MAG: RHH-type proline utilization regulon transcriptional repressor/proline dehydrogenase, partial [Bacteriovoracaceae bacterium]